MNVLITGASGFVGSETLVHLAEQGIALGRRKPVGYRGRFYKSTISESVDYRLYLSGISTIIHCAARTHIMQDHSSDPLEEYRKVNTRGTLNLARQAAEAGVKRFIFISTVKVNGESTQPGQPFTESISSPPEDPYALSKYEAEVGLQELARETGLEVVIIRPPLVYGPGVKGNFRTMIQWVRKGFPLPLGAVNNKRSMVALDNLVDLIITCIDHPKAANEVFLVSDDNDLSISEILQGLASAMGKKSRLVSVPESVLLLIARFFRFEPAMGRLCGSLQVDSSKVQRLLGWKPSVKVEDGFGKIFSDSFSD